MNWLWHWSSKLKGIHTTQHHKIMQVDTQSCRLTQYLHNTNCITACTTCIASLILVLVRSNNICFHGAILYISAIYLSFFLSSSDLYNQFFNTGAPICFQPCFISVLSTKHLFLSTNDIIMQSIHSSIIVQIMLANRYSNERIHAKILNQSISTT